MIQKIATKFKNRKIITNETTQFRLKNNGFVNNMIKWQKYAADILKLIYMKCFENEYFWYKMWFVENNVDALQQNWDVGIYHY